MEFGATDKYLGAAPPEKGGGAKIYPETGGKKRDK